MRKRLILFMVMACMSVTLMAGCGKENKKEEAKGETGTEEQAKEDETMDALKPLDPIVEDDKKDDKGKTDNGLEKDEKKVVGDSLDKEVQEPFAKKKQFLAKHEKLSQDLLSFETKTFASDEKMKAAYKGELNKWDKLLKEVVDYLEKKQLSGTDLETFKENQEYWEESREEMLNSDEIVLDDAERFNGVIQLTKERILILITNYVE